MNAKYKSLPSVAELGRRIEVTLALATRMTAAFDKNYEALVRAQRAKAMRTMGSETEVGASVQQAHGGAVKRTRQALYLSAGAVLLALLAGVAYLFVNQ